MKRGSLRGKLSRFASFKQPTIITIVAKLRDGLLHLRHVNDFSRKLSDLPDNFLFSSVVFMELMASAGDDAQRRELELAYRYYAKDNSLIVPNDEDWLMASKVLYWLTQSRRRISKGKLLRLKPGATQRMALDTLIAVSARRWNTTIITDNWDDFKAIQRYCKIKIIKGSDFFQR